jgi:inorganic pyrophosphatase
VASIDPHDFWAEADRWIAGGRIVIDRPKGSPHPRRPSFRYPLDYGYLAGTRSGDGEGIDVWIGSSSRREVTGFVATMDAEKQDAELKLLVGCLPEEAQAILEIHNRGDQFAILVLRDRQRSAAAESIIAHPQRNDGP